MYEDQPSARPYGYPIHPGMNTTDAEQNNQCYPGGPPSLPHDGRYQMEHTNNTRYYASPVLPTSSSLHHGAQSYQHNHSVPRNQQQHISSHFIPTPSELTQLSRHHLGGPQGPGHQPELTSHEYNMSRGSLQQPPRLSTPTRPRTGSGGSPTTTTGERFACEKCGKTFSRSHDRKRHHETQHLPTPVIHRCRYCEKEFSRADSLKRHVDNGCDEMP